MEPIKAVIIDDEPDATSNLSSLISNYCQGVTVSGTAHTIKQAVKVINQTSPDVIFLDIELQRGTGFDLLDCFAAIDFQIIFVTAYQEYALKAIKVGALDYLLKPIDLDELQKVIDKVKQGILNLNGNVPAEAGAITKKTAGRLILHSLQGFSIIDIRDLLYCKADGNYLHFVCSDGKDHLVTKNMKEYEELLAPHNFFRIHHGFLVNLRAVRQFIKTDGNMVVLQNGEKLPVSTRKRDAFIHRIEMLDSF